MQEDILSLPAISLYSHNYYQNYLFKGALQLQVGIDLFYNTSFYADNYAPPSCSSTCNGSIKQAIIPRWTLS